MTRFLPVFFAVAASAACASTGYSPRAFPTAPAGAVARGPSPVAVGPATPAGPVPRAAAGPSVAATASERATTSAAVLSTAMGLTGVPYRLGGSNPSGFDCSGFVLYVLAQHGIAMPRTVIEQFTVGEISPAVEPGDLVFFQTVGSKASHVGLAIDAQSFVHAPNSRGVVRVERLDSAYWADRFLGARRVF
ncbi:MAG: NlpC/P60 family protein [Vicinamibacterales bacterium]